MSDLKRTPLYANHVALNAKLVDFGGWEMPVQYSGIVKEHMAVREKAGAFDVSHMGEFEISGPEALSFLKKTTANDPSKLGIGRGQYSLFLNNEGGTIDDIIVYRTGKSTYLIVVNASNIDKDWTHVSQVAKDYPKMVLKNKSAQYALIALQGPLAEECLSAHVDRDLSEIGLFRIRQASFDGKSVRIARTGYTGEGKNGFEIFTETRDAAAVWETLVANTDVIPCGLGARDTLRIEASLPLYGHELDDTTSPIEAGLGIFVSQSDSYIGADTIRTQRTEGTQKTLVTVEMIDRGIPRQGYTLNTLSGEQIGQVTSGTTVPWIGKSVAMAYVSPQHSEIGTQILVQVRDRELKAQIVPRPFFKR
ncbi:MAG: glycine cleavage system aminomethyltransferase GcvT [Candidatus Latescibacteria bacterium]|jgi:aminomethyltransferase|nr:glycine cleavage system aminomethyltransferase GcvT [Candidatus Latescibacterota bacterium]